MAGRSTFVLCAAVLMSLALLPATGSARTTQVKNGNYIGFWVHFNAYDHWGSCHSGDDLNKNPRWQDESGGCVGMVEAGVFLQHQFVHSSKGSFTWLTGNRFHMEIPGMVLDGIKTSNWNDFELTSAKIDGVIYRSGHFGSGSLPRGQAGGPIAVDLSSHHYWSGMISRYGYSIDLQGYLIKK